MKSLDFHFCLKRCQAYHSSIKNTAFKIFDLMIAKCVTLEDFLTLAENLRFSFIR